MKAPRTALLAVTALTAAATALAPVAQAAPKAKADKPVKPKFVVSKLSIVKHKKTVDIASGEKTVKVHVTVKDKSKAFDPKSVRLVVAEKVSGEEATRVVVKAKLVGKSKVVSNWRAKLAIPADAVEPGSTATYCVKLVKVNDDDPSTLPVVKTAKGLTGRDCVTVVNSSTPAV